MPKIDLIHGDCLEKMKDIPDGSACRIKPLWEQYKRIIKERSIYEWQAIQ